MITASTTSQKPSFLLKILIHTYLVVSAATCFAQNNSSAIRNETQILKWKVGDTVREAMVCVPATAKTKSTPIVFVYHGHGGNMTNIFRSRGFEKLWPEAIIICPQGLNTPGQLTDPQGKLSGWQKAPGDMADRDLNFFDAMLKTMCQKYKIDDKRIYCTGHSNGGDLLIYCGQRVEMYLPLWRLRQQ